MISEDHLDQLSLTWFQDSGWEYCYGSDFAAVASMLGRSRMFEANSIYDIEGGAL